MAPAGERWPELFHELRLLVERVGMSPAGLLRRPRSSARGPLAGSATWAAEPGKLADMVVLREDPLADIEHLKSVVMTIKRGRVFARSDFVPLQDADVADFY